MATYQGIVSDIKDKDTIEVSIYPMTEGIPNAPSNINQILCHTPSEGSLIKIEAINNKKIKAKIGDFVLVEHTPSGVIKNLCLLVLIPITCGIMGFIFKGLLFATIFFFFGIGIGGFLYKVISGKKNLPIIVSIIKNDLTPICKFKKKEGLSCQSCPLNLR